MRGTLRRRVTTVAMAATLAATTSACVIDLPDGAVPGRTGCSIVWLEPDRLVPQQPTETGPSEPGVDDPRGLAIIFLGILSLVPTPICTG